MPDRDIHIPPSSSDRDVLGCRVSTDVQERFGKFVDEYFENRHGAYGYCVEKALIEFMDNDRYARMEERLSKLESTVNQTNALVKKIVTAEKEKGAFLESAPKGNQAGSRKEREDAVVREWCNHVAGGKLSRSLPEDKLNALIVNVADVTSTPSKRDYRESFIERGLMQVEYAEYTLTDKAFEYTGFEDVIQ